MFFGEFYSHNFIINFLCVSAPLWEIITTCKFDVFVSVITDKNVYKCDVRVSIEYTFEKDTNIIDIKDNINNTIKDRCYQVKIKNLS